MDKAKPEQSNYWVPMVEHTFRILELFYSDDAELTLQQVSSCAGVSKTSAFRILFTLDKLGYISRNDSTRSYRLGMKILETARKAIPSRNLVQLVRPYMKRLHEQFDETVNFAVLQNGEVSYVEIVESSQSFRMVAEVGSRVPLHSTALGKCIAAFLPSSEVQEMLQGYELTQFTPKTIRSRQDFHKALARVRQKGFGLDNEETELGAFCIAAPILKERRAVAGISLSGPTPRLRLQQKEIVQELRKITEAVSEQISQPAVQEK